MFKKILIVLVIIVAAFSVVAYLQPAEYSVSRSITISAPTDIVFSQVNNLKNFNQWDPWAKIDPSSQAVFEGPEEGVGSKLSWNSEKMDVGQGSMTNVETKNNEYLKYDMQFTKPMSATAIAEFKFAAKDGGTEVTWSTSGNKKFICKAMGLIFNTDKMIGDQFDKGLGDLKARVETTK